MIRHVSNGDYARIEVSINPTECPTENNDFSSILTILHSNIVSSLKNSDGCPHIPMTLPTSDNYCPTNHEKK